MEEIQGLEMDSDDSMQKTHDTLLTLEILK